MRAAASPIIAAALLLLPSLASAGPAKKRVAGAEHPDCLAELDSRGIAYKRASAKGIAIGVEVQGPLGGVTFVGSGGRALILDCSLAISLDEAGRYLTGLGIDHALFSSAYSRRYVRGTDHWSKHSFGLAIDVHSFTGPEVGTLVVAADYEQGLGDDIDCVGQPLTQGGALLKVAQCQLVRSGLFHLVLSPDYDDAHHDHFHLEAPPWKDRTGLRAGPAIH